MSKSADQPGKAPTRKLTAATLGVAIVETARVTAENMAPGWADPTMWTALAPVVAFLCGYVVRDAPNSPDGE